VSSGSGGHALRLAVGGPSFWSLLWLPFLAGLIVPYRSAARPEPTPPRVSDADGAAEAETRPARYLVIVVREEVALYQHLRRQFAGDAAVRVFVDRRRRARLGSGPPRGPEAEERRRPSGPGRERRFCWIVEASSEQGSTRAPRPANSRWRPTGQGRRSMEGLGDRQRVDRWIEESQYLIGRMIPGILDDRERLRGKLEAAEQECARLRQEIGELRKEVADLQSETQFFRGEHAAMAEALREVIEHVSQVQKPLNDVFRRLQVTQPVLSQSAA
jgi:hypothetical protein